MTSTMRRQAELLDEQGHDVSARVMREAASDLETANQLVDKYEKLWLEALEERGELALKLAAAECYIKEQKLEQP